MQMSRRQAAPPTCSRPARSWPATCSAGAIAAGIGMTIGSVFGRTAGRRPHAVLEDRRRTNARHTSDRYEEADRLMTVCNSCRYCEGLCAVFPAMEMRRAFSGPATSTISPTSATPAAPATPTASSRRRTNSTINVPKTLGGRACAESYAAYAWPRAFSGAVRAQRASSISIVAALSVARLHPRASLASTTSSKLLSASTPAPGAFYKLMPHNVMAALFSAAFLYCDPRRW